MKTAPTTGPCKKDCVRASGGKNPKITRSFCRLYLRVRGCPHTFQNIKLLWQPAYSHRDQLTKNQIINTGFKASTRKTNTSSTFKTFGKGSRAAKKKWKQNLYA